MRDDLANLQILTLPGGATTGERIVLNGQTGEIEFYDSADNLVMHLNGSTFIRVFTLLSSQTVLAAKTITATNPEFSITTQGILSWGPGTAIFDVQLLREDVDLLRVAGGSLRVDGDFLNASEDKIFHAGSFSGNTATVSGQTGCLTIPHGAGFTPSFIMVQPTSPFSGGNIFVGCVVRTALTDGTNFVIRFINQAGGAPDGVAIAGHYVVFP